MIIFAIPTQEIRTIKATTEIWPESIQDVSHLEYLIEFFPTKNEYSTTNYSLIISKNNESDSDINVQVQFEDVELTFLKKNYNYDISITSRKVSKPNLNVYDKFFSGTHTELFLKKSDIGDAQKFRIDETVIFSDFFKKGLSTTLKKLDLEFEYHGIEIYNSFLTHYYNTKYNWESNGTTYDAISNWTLNTDLYFEKETGILVAEKLHAIRVDLKPR